MVRRLDGLQERTASYSRRRIKHRNVRFLAFPVFQRSGAPEEIRTPDPQIRSLVLYPAELRALVAHRAGNAPGSAKAGGNGPFPIGFPPHWQVCRPSPFLRGPLAEERPKAASRSNAGRRRRPAHSMCRSRVNPRSVPPHPSRRSLCSLLRMSSEVIRRRPTTVRDEARIARTGSRALATPDPSRSRAGARRGAR